MYIVDVFESSLQSCFENCFDLVEYFVFYLLGFCAYQRTFFTSWWPLSLAHTVAYLLEICSKCMFDRIFSVGMNVWTLRWTKKSFGWNYESLLNFPFLTLIFLILLHLFLNAPKKVIQKDLINYCQLSIIALLCCLYYFCSFLLLCCVLMFY